MSALPSQHADAANERRFVWTAWLVHLLAISVVAWFHEPWRDEFQAWRLAIDSPGLRALWDNSRYEGHPLLWHIALQWLGHVSRAWWVAAAFHTALASGTAWLILRRAPLPRWQRVAMVASFYLFYGYGIIVRSYGLGVFFVFAACAAWTAERRRPWLAGVLLALAGNTSVFGLLVAGAAAFAFWLEWAFPDDGQVNPSWAARIRVSLLLGVAALSVAYVAYLQVVQPPGSAFQSAPISAYDGWRWRLAEVLATGARAFLPNPTLSPNGVEWRFGMAFSGTFAGMASIDAASMLALVLGVVATIRRRSAVALYVVGFIALTSFVALIFGGAQRHHGHLVIIWLLSVWLAGAGPATSGAWERWTRSLQRFSPAAFTMLSIPMLVATLQYSVGEIRYPFSDATNVARFLRQPDNVALPLIAAVQGEAVSVAAQVPQPVFFSIEGRTATFATWWYIHPTIGETDPDRAAAVGTDRRVTSELHRVCEVLVLTTDRAPIPEPLRHLGTVVWQSQGLALIGERYVVWRLRSPFRNDCGPNPPSPEPLVQSSSVR